MQKVLTAAQMREVDRLTTERYGIPSIILMENAAHAVARAITEKLGGSVKGESILILCGRGNNGGDGAALARILWQSGADVYVCLLCKIDETSGDARRNLEIVEQLSDLAVDVGGPEVFFDQVLSSTDWTNYLEKYFHYAEPEIIVDAMFGTGLTKPLTGHFEVVARWVRGQNVADVEQDSLVFAIDIPSGLDADRPEYIGQSLRANWTITFTAPKPPNVLPPVNDFNGELIVANIGSPHQLIDEQPSRLYLSEKEDAAKWLLRSRFSDDSYKNKRGHVFLFAGSEDYSGAAVLAANAAMRSGVGLTTLACPGKARELIASRLQPEVILSTIESPDFNERVAKADAIAVGCGLDANDPSIEKLVRDLVEKRTRPVIVDASALWFFDPPSGDDHTGGGPSTPLLRKEGSLETAPMILTPHEGEFLRLLGTADKAVIKDRVAAVHDFATRNSVILVLKGERVLIGEPGGNVIVNPTGNSGLGKAGNGDTLTGILAGFVAQAAKMNIDIFETVVAAVYIAGMAGDVAEKKYGKRVMTASDVRECLVEVFRAFDGKTA